MKFLITLFVILTVFMIIINPMVAGFGILAVGTIYYFFGAHNADNN